MCCQQDGRDESFECTSFTYSPIRGFGTRSFTICSFWLVSALCEIGEVRRARRLCAKLLSYASPLLLYAEELDPATGGHLGNFPQAFTHLALINAVMHIIRANRDLELAERVATREFTTLLRAGP